MPRPCHPRLALTALGGEDPFEVADVAPARPSVGLDVTTTILATAALVSGALLLWRVWVRVRRRADGERAGAEFGESESADV